MKRILVIAFAVFMLVSLAACSFKAGSGGLSGADKPGGSSAGGFPRGRTAERH